MGALGPAILGKLLGPGADRGTFGASGSEITPELAESVTPEAVREAAEQAARKDPSIIDQLSRIYAGQPQIVKTLGAAALTVALAKVAQRHGVLYARPRVAARTAARGLTRPIVLSVPAPA